MRKRYKLFFLAVLVLTVTIAFSFSSYLIKTKAEENQKDYITWVEFNVPYAALKKAMDLDIASHQDGPFLSMVDSLAFLAAKYGDKWGQYKAKDLDNLYEKIKGGETLESLTGNMKYYSFYQERYQAVLGNFVGEFSIDNGQPDEAGNPTMETKYGLKAYSPIAYGYSYSHYEDFGNSRSYGFSRRHLGNDLIGSIGTPIVAVESGTIQNIGWNRYGGWRIGIRSLDGKRYYYYAHLRKNHPYAPQLKEGDTVLAGDVIGYLGMTGYSDKENVNGMNVPHLHFGMQLIFDESQVESDNEIWIDVYHIVELLRHHTSPVVKSEKDYLRKYPFSDPALEPAEG